MKNIEALRIIYQKLKDQKIKWILVGSTSLALQGVRIRPKDIDILTEKAGAFKINRLLKEYETEPVELKESEMFQSYFGKFQIKEVTVEVMGNLKIKIGDKWTPSEELIPQRTLEINDMYLPVFSLETELKLYERLGRKKDSVRIQKIKETLKSR